VGFFGKVAVYGSCQARGRASRNRRANVIHGVFVAKLGAAGSILFASLGLEDFYAPVESIPRRKVRFTTQHSGGVGLVADRHTLQFDFGPRRSMQMSIFSTFFKGRGQLSRKSSADPQASSGSLCAEDGLLHTGDLRVKQNGEDFDISLADESLVNTFRAKFPGTGETISGDRALIIAHVFAALDGALETWKLAEPAAWSESANRELRALSRICSRLGGNTRPIDFFCDSQRIRNVAASFVNVLRKHPGIRPKFGSGRFTVYNVTMQFGNLLGCGGAVSASANLYG
jgi:hypothetical protein